jgi:peptidoglycan/LPS O-acetylase OafA/YrhL
MQSTSGAYYRGLDHVRALAAFAVYWWHVTHLYVAPQYVPPVFVLSWFEEGQTGVALFMTLSGYLFAKLADGRDVQIGAFLWNRLCRLAPLFVAVYLFYALSEGYRAIDLLRGLWWPDLWPGLSWSLAIELQFYLLFPLLHRWLRPLTPARRCAVLLAVVAACVGVRLATWLATGSVQYLAYSTLVGRADQLLLGMVFFEASKTAWLQRWQRPLFAATVLAVLLFYHWLNLRGGAQDGYPQLSRSAHWIWLPLVEGAAYGLAIACYDGLSRAFTGRLSGAIARIGDLSYSIYMIHSALVLGLLYAVLPDGTPLSIAIPAGLAFFPLVVALAHLTHRYIEQPFFRFRRPYLLAPPTPVPAPPASAAARAGASA